ncbi:MAG: HD domain-containing protein [Chloroflexi bacterium]|nr:HD domain-containing protein [Chloroflexota bacterium]
MWSDLGAHVRRFFRGFRGTLTPDETGTVEALLSPEEFQCFCALQGREQRHAVDVLRHLQAHGAPSDDLLVAALLHNVGKGHIRLHERVAYTLLAMFTPRLLARVALPDGRGFRGAMAAQRDHPALGAEALAAIGVRPRVIELVRGHHDGSAGGDEELAALIEADLLR